MAPCSLAVGTSPGFRGEGNFELDGFLGARGVTMARNRKRWEARAVGEPNFRQHTHIGQKRAEDLVGANRETDMAEMMYFRLHWTDSSAYK